MRPGSGRAIHISCSTRPESARANCCQRSRSSHPSGYCMCRAIPQRWREMWVSWYTSMGSNCWPLVWSICLPTPRMWNPWHCWRRGKASMAIEIERKFRLLNESWREQIESSTLLRQGYLANTARASVRVRLAGTEGWLSVKAMTPGMARAEYEAAIAATDASEMLDRLCEGPLVEKWRHIVLHDGSEW